MLSVESSSANSEKTENAQTSLLSERPLQMANSKERSRELSDSISHAGFCPRDTILVTGRQSPALSADDED